MERPSRQSVTAGAPAAVYADRMQPIPFILEVLRRCGAVARRHFGRTAERIKPHDRHQVVTEADLEIARLVADAIDAAFPDHSRLDEELGGVDRGSPYTWVVDPIDGTSNFAAGVPLYGTMIGLLHDGRPAACGVGLPAFDALYWAERGAGAFCGERRLAMADGDLSAALVAFSMDGDPDDPGRTRAECAALAEIAMAARGVRASNSVYDAALLAEGRYGGWVVWSSHIWDSVAPHLLIEEAGGVFTRADGGAVAYHAPLARVADNFPICAAPPRMHGRLLAALCPSR